MSGAESGATGIIPPRPNLLLSATMMTLLATSIIFCSEPTTTVLLLQNPGSVTLPMPMMSTSARIAVREPLLSAFLLNTGHFALHTNGYVRKELHLTFPAILADLDCY